MRKVYLISAIFIIAAGAALEFFARSILGLGTPPLSVEHPTIEYKFKPNQDVNRFGNRVAFNQFGMRSDNFDIYKSADEFRVMLFGDSVLNGGAQTDQYDLATEIIARELNITNKSITVGNISAGSWGPGNWLAYANEFGFFDADIVILVLSSHDIADNPSFNALNPRTHPTRNPRSAFLEGVYRYLPNYLPSFIRPDRVIDESDQFHTPAEEAIAIGSQDLRDFLILAKAASPHVLVVQHWEQPEVINSSPQVGYQLIKDICNELAIPTISLYDDLRKSHNANRTPWRDNIHLNEVGQQILAKAILRELEATCLSKN